MPFHQHDPCVRPIGGDVADQIEYRSFDSILPINSSRLRGPVTGRSCHVKYRHVWRADGLSQDGVGMRNDPDLCIECLSKVELVERR